MTRLEPQLALLRLIVVREGIPVYDEKFHHGVNIIRGENGSGKTTIADFIFFALGGEPANWRSEALLCHFVFAEIELNGIRVTLRREISSQPFRPLSIFWGDYDTAAGSAAEGWSLYPYSARTDVQSFSQVIFNALGMPRVTGQLASRITLHQLLRLVYVDQRSPIDDIFRTEKFDPALVREAIGWLACGVYDSILYEAELSLRTSRADHQLISDELKQANAVFAGAWTSAAALREELANQNTARLQLYTGIHDFRKSQADRMATGAAASTHSVADSVEGELRTLNAEVSGAREELDTLTFEVADSDLFLAALEEKLKALDDSTLVRSGFGEIPFHVCPACYATLPPTDDDGACALCKTKYVAGVRNGQLLRLRQELSLQLDESRSLQGDRRKRMAELNQALPILTSRQRALRLRRQELASSTDPEADAALGDMYRNIGYIDRRIEDLQERIGLAEKVEALSERKAQLAGDISRLEDEILRRRQEHESRRKTSHDAIERFTREMLERDLDREGTFREVKSVEFDFASGRIAVNDRSNYAASSMVYLKNSFHLAILQASATEAFFKYPRFVLFDNVEDKGMEPGRSHNFQRLVVEASANLEVVHQIIFTTSMIASELEVSEYTIGDSYTRSNKSLRIIPN